MENVIESSQNSEFKQQDTKAIFNAFEQEFATSVHSIKVSSLGREVAFRDISTKEQKTLSKLSMENENRKDIIYDAQCQLINKLSLEKSFDVYAVTELDRIRILMEIYQNNFFRNDISYKCDECGKTNTYKLDFQKIIDKFDNFDVSDDIFTVDDQKRTFKFVINYPLVRNVSNFYRDYMKKYKGVSSNERQALDNLGVVEFVNLFIKNIEMIYKDDTNKRISVDLTLMTYAEIEKLLDMFPSSVVFSDTTGVINYILTKFISKIDTAFQYEKCAHCGAETKQGIGSLADFF